MHSHTPPLARSGLSWAIFCQVIDNLGDIGVCWRLACNLAVRGQQVQLWVDEPAALDWMAPHGHAGVTVQHWTARGVLPPPGDVVVEAFGCQLPPGFIASMAHCASARVANGLKKPVWINLEYLSAEPYVERSHQLPSPQANGLTKHFFYPGFSAATGGLLREPDLLVRQARFDRVAWLQAQGIDWQGERLVSLFCYEPSALDSLLAQLGSSAIPTRLLVTPGRAWHAVMDAQKRRAGLASGGAVSFFQLPYLPQIEFDHLLWACDFNFVRGEDSLVRAIWAGKPFIWHIYPQADGAHQAKLAAFLAWLAAPADLHAAHGFWNNTTGQPVPLVFCQPPALAAAQDCIRQARARLLAQPDLASQLLDFVGAQH